MDATVPLKRFSVLNYMIEQLRDHPLDSLLLEGVRARAAQLSALLFGHKQRRNGKYAVEHNSAVAEAVMRDGLGAIEQAAAHLHDGEEDEDLTRQMLVDNFGQEFGDAIAELVDYLTRREDESFHDYMLRLLDGASRLPNLIIIKDEDRLDNVRDPYGGSKEGEIAFLIETRDEFLPLMRPARSLLPDSRLQRRHDAILDEIEERVTTRLAVLRTEDPTT